MDGIHLHFTVRASFSLLLLILLQTSTEAQICSAPGRVKFPENNTVDAVVANINVQPGVSIAFTSPSTSPDYPFRLDGHQLIATRVLDYETAKDHVVQITCRDSTNFKLDIIIIVLVTNLNDNPPVFAQSSFSVNVSELSPKGKCVDHFSASDADGETLYYELKPASDLFKLRSTTVPDLLVEKPLDYDKVKNVQLILYAQDTPLDVVNPGPSFTASTTIEVTIIDVDNRSPWFQPCTEHEMGGALICQSSGYTGRVVLNEQEAGVLPLKPGPLYAVDGDNGIKEEITYSILSGNGDGLFAINPSTGNISMLKPADVLGTISLTVLAAQKNNSYQFATTTVTISVQVKSLHRPKFQESQYESVITGVGDVAMDPKSKEPLRIVAIDDDYTATGGLNPHITYSIKGSSDFSIINGYLFMTKDLPEETLSLQVVARDTTNDESASAQLVVEVKAGLNTTTSVPLSTTENTATTSIGESTTDGMTTEDFMSTIDPTTSTDSSISTAIPSATSESIISTANTITPTEGTVTTAHPLTAIVPSGGYGLTDMAAVGATLGVLLFICLVVIAVLVCNMRKGKADWRKIYETSMFRSSLGQGSGGQKEGIQYTNEAFQNDEDGDSTGSSSPTRGSVVAAEEPQKAAGASLIYETTTQKSSLPLHAILDDNTSQAGSDKSDNEKEVKPILTKERRMDEGYKSVWFKEDIDPDAKEEVVIIPDSRESDSEEEVEEQPSSSREEDEDDDNPRIKTSRVMFNDADVDSGLGEKMEDPAEDSGDEEMLTSDL